MLTQTLDTARLGVIGLGYVGLPVAVDAGRSRQYEGVRRACALASRK